MKAYKYFDSSLKNKILEEGVFRIGTLGDYRRIESHGKEIGDSQEGKIGAYSQVSNWSSSNSMHHEHANSFVSGGDLVLSGNSSISLLPSGEVNFGTKEISLKNIVLRSELQVPDLYIFSFASMFDEKIMEKMGYDACYEISDIDEFLSCFGIPLSNYLGWSSVSYESKEIHFSIAKTKNPAWIKEQSFEYQKECRALWEPYNYPVSPCFITVPAAAKLCKLL